MTSVGGIVLTGGASRRIGVDKATFVLDGETLAQRAARVLDAVCEPVIEVGPGVTSLRAVREHPPGSGPLAALVAGADALGVAPVVLLACDMPFVEAPLLELLARYGGPDTVVPLADGRAQYTCARYGADAVDAARSALVRGERSFVRTFADVEHLAPEVWQQVAPAHAFTDVDTPEDVARLGLQRRR